MVREDAYAIIVLRWRIAAAISRMCSEWSEERLWALVMPIKIPPFGSLSAFEEDPHAG